MKCHKGPEMEQPCVLRACVRLCREGMVTPEGGNSLCRCPQDNLKGIFLFLSSILFE